jgi:uncharacterized membrane protein
MFITFKNLTGFAFIGIILTLVYALLGAVPFTIPMMLLVLLIASIACGKIA